MSMAALRWVRPIQCPPPQKSILWALADQANDDGECWPTTQQIVEATCLSARCVQTALVALCDAGRLRREIGGGRGRATVYRLAIETPHAVHPSEPSGPAETPQEVRNTPHAVRSIAEQKTPQVVRETPQEVPKTPQVVRETPQEVHPNPNNPQQPSEPSPPQPPASSSHPSGDLLKAEPPAAGKRRAKPDLAAIPLPFWLPPDAWAAWCAYRKAGRAPLTDHAAALCIGNLEKLAAAGNEPKAVIEQSIACGWTGLFPLKGGVGRAMAAIPPKRNQHDQRAFAEELMREEAAARGYGDPVQPDMPPPRGPVWDATAEEALP